MRRRGGAARAALALGAALALLGGCASDGDAPRGGVGLGGDGGRVQQCRAGDTRVASEADCLRDDAACYALASGEFCTGERGNTCPAGSAALPAGAPCPPGARCFVIGESLTCTVASSPAG